MFIAVAGLLGAGKSTLVNNLAINNNYVEFQEPVKNNPFLDLYYNDPKRWAFALQMYYLWERYKQHQEAFYRSLKGETVILDSTIYSDAAFALVQKQENYFTSDEYNTYINMHKILSAQLAYPDIFIWLDIDSKKSLDRINKRSRNCESGIPIDYLNKLKDAYCIILEKLSKHTNIVTVDASKDINSVYSEVSKIISNYKYNDDCNAIKYL